MWNIKVVGNYIVSFERPKGRREVVQCKNCPFWVIREHDVIVILDVSCAVTFTQRMPVRAPSNAKQKAPLYIQLAFSACGEMHFGNYKRCKTYRQIRKKRMGKPVPRTQFVNHQFVAPQNLAPLNRLYSQVLTSGSKTKNSVNSSSTVAPIPIIPINQNIVMIEELRP